MLHWLLTGESVVLDLFAVKKMTDMILRTSVKHAEHKVPCP